MFAKKTDESNWVRAFRGACRVACLLMLLPMTPFTASAGFGLWLLEQRIALEFDVPQLDSAEFAQTWSPASEEWLLIDVRQPEEFHLSHLQGAIRFDPEGSRSDFFSDNSPFASVNWEGRKVLFYCSVGYRSSAALERLQKALLQRGVLLAANLRGGLFRWYNQGGEVVNDKGPTDAIHPYDQEWGRYLELR